LNLLPAVIPDNVFLPSYQQGDDIRDFISKNPNNLVEEVADSQGKVYHIIKSQPLNTFELKRESPATDFARVGLYLSNYSHGKRIARHLLKYTLRYMEN
jgi:serine/threonine-protein kinase SRPK3